MYSTGTQLPCYNGLIVTTISVKPGNSRGKLFTFYKIYDKSMLEGHTGDKIHIKLLALWIRDSYYLDRLRRQVKQDEKPV